MMRAYELLKTHSSLTLKIIRVYNINAQVTVTHVNYLLFMKHNVFPGEDVFSGQQDQGCCVHERDGAET